MRREVSFTVSKRNYDARLVLIVARELQVTFPPVPSERAALIRASQALGMTPEAIRPHYRGDVQKADAAIIAMCRLIRGAECIANWLEAR